MLSLKKGWNNKIKAKKVNDRLILLIHGENMKNICQNVCRIFSEIPWQKIYFYMFRKLNTSAEHELEFLMLLKGNSLQNVTFFCKNPQKVIEE